MPKLILSMDGLVLKEVVLATERTTIGRRSSNDIQIDNLAISGEHAVITTILGDAFLEDRNSTNGTFVNGRPIKRHALKSNDVIELGKYRLKYIIEEIQPGSAVEEMIDSGDLGHAPLESSAHGGEEGDKTVVAFPDLDLQEESGPASARLAIPADEAVRIGVIEILSGANAGKQLELTKSLSKLGKPGAPTAVITRRAEGYYITQVDSSNEAQLNGQVLGVQPKLLGAHDIIEISGVKMEFFLRA